MKETTLTTATSTPTTSSPATNSAMAFPTPPSTTQISPSPPQALPYQPTQQVPPPWAPPPPRPLGHRGADQRHDQQTLPPWTAPRCRSCISGSPRRRSSPCGQLRGFERVEVAKGDAVKVVFEVKRRDISFWDVKRQQWGVVGGRYEVEVGGEFEGFEVERGV